MTDRAEKIYYNCTIATADADFRFAEALATDEERILAVGSKEEVLALRGSQTEMIDLEERKDDTVKIKRKIGSTGDKESCQLILIELDNNLRTQGAQF